MKHFKCDSACQLAPAALNGLSVCVHWLHVLTLPVAVVADWRLRLQVPLQLIECAECRDMFQLHITCKDCKVIR